MLNKKLFLFSLGLVSIFIVAAQPFINEVKAFSKQDSISKPPEGAILLIGSSSFTKWKDVGDYFPDKTIVNRAFGGSSLPHLIDYADQIIFPYNPAQIIIYCGENDVASSKSITADTVLNRFKRLHGLIRTRYPKVPIAFVSLKPSPVRVDFLTTVKETNRLIKDFCTASSNTAFIDVFTPMLNPDGSFMEELFVSDRLHMNAKGYIIWKKVMEPYLVNTKAPAKKAVAAVKRPNIIWLSTEDMGPRLGCYGDMTVPTPYIDRLAKEGIKYTNVFTAAGVCAPSRNAIITGRIQTSNGGHNMRVLGNTYPEQTGLPKSYSAVLPVGVKHLGEYLRAEGYYCTNNAKTDYQFEENLTFWDENSNKAHYRNRAKDQPFFAVFNSNITHESQVWDRAKRPLRVDPRLVKVPPIYPDTDSVRLDIARFYTNISEMDDWVGEKIKELESEGLLENTIVMFWADHGDGLPYVKREITDRGLRVPLIIRFPNNGAQKVARGVVDPRLISSIDYAPTVLSLAGIKPPSNMQGRPFLGPYASKGRNTYVFAARDRLDSHYDRVRSVHDGRYQYVYNFHPELPRYMDLAYRKQQASMRDIIRLRDAGKLNAVQMRWFEPKGATEELYDVLADPYQLNDLARDTANAVTLSRFREVFNKWQKDVPDLGAIPEKQLIRQMWNGAEKPPLTADPLFVRSNNVVAIKCITDGASIAYKVVGSDGVVPRRWEVYSAPLLLEKDQRLMAVAQRIGYMQSKIVE